MSGNAYTRHTPEELEIIRELARQPMIAQQNAARIAQVRAECYTGLENINTLADELRDLLDVLDEGRQDHLQVDTRGLSGRLRMAERELEAAISSLATQMGLVGIEE